MREKENATFTQMHFSISPLKSIGRDAWVVSLSLWRRHLAGTLTNCNSYMPCRWGSITRKVTQWKLYICNSPFLTYIMFNRSTECSAATQLMNLWCSPAHSTPIQHKKPNLKTLLSHHPGDKTSQGITCSIRSTIWGQWAISKWSQFVGHNSVTNNGVT